MAPSLVALVVLAGLAGVSCTRPSTRHLSQQVISVSSTSSGDSGGLSSTSVQQSDLWNVSGLVISCGGLETHANSWDGTTCVFPLRTSLYFRNEPTIFVF